MNFLPRRRLLAAGALAAGTAVLSPVVRAVGSDGMTTVAARPARDLVDSLGVNVHVGYFDTPYFHLDKVIALLRELRAGYVRDEFRYDQPAQWGQLRRLGDAGIRSALIAGPRPDHVDRSRAGTPESNVAVIRRELPLAVASIEGTNEWDLWGGPNWVQEVRSWQRRLYDAVKADAVLGDATVLAPSVATREAAIAAGDFSTMADRANAHIYADGQQPGAVLRERMHVFQERVAPMRAQLTETGYHNTMGPPSPDTAWHKPVPEGVAAAYLPRLLADALVEGFERTYFYELFDLFPDPARARRESNFGLVRNDQTRKPAFLALRDLQQLADGGRDRPADVDATASLRFGVDGAPDDLRQLLLRRADGRFLLLLWRDVSVWNAKARRAVDVRPADVSVHLARSARWQVHRPGDGAAPVARGEGERVSLRLGGRMAAVLLADA